MTEGGEFAMKTIGLVGQAFFFGRFLVQWLATERARRIAVPTAFWWMSLWGGVLSLAYTIWDADPIMLIGAAIPIFIYVRNLALVRSGRPLRGGLLLPLGIGVAAATTITFGLNLDATFSTLPPLWLVIGSVGQGLWVSRFPLQWWIAEKTGRPTLPPVFFSVGLAGSILLLAYAIWKRDPVYIAGQALTPFLNARTLWIAKRASSHETGADKTTPANDAPADGNPGHRVPASAR